MTIDDSARPDPGDNPVVDLEPDSIDVHADFDCGGIVLEVVDGTGAGFRTILDWPNAVDVALRLVAAAMRLRGVIGAP